MPRCSRRHTAAATLPPPVASDVARAHFALPFYPPSCTIAGKSAMVDNLVAQTSVLDPEYKSKSFLAAMGVRLQTDRGIQMVPLKEMEEAARRAAPGQPGRLHRGAPACQQHASSATAAFKSEVGLRLSTGWTRLHRQYHPHLPAAARGSHPLLAAPHQNAPEQLVNTHVHLMSPGTA